MAATWSTEQVLALAPDAGSAKAGKDLANPRKWSGLGRDEVAAWGECQGSGASPYQAKIDLGEPAFHCTCPSHKFPCKHALGLFLLLAQQPAAFTAGTPPAWVADWLAARAKREEQKAKKAQKAEQPAGEVDPEQARRAAERQQKSAAERQAKVDAGLNDLDRWLGDLARRGLAAVRGEPYSFWEWPAARMVDAQAPGVARWIRDMAGIPSSGDGWQDRLLERLGRLSLLLEGYRRLDQLPAETRADIRALVGWTQSQEELLASAGVRDRWAVLGQRVEDDDRLRVQRRWLRGESTGRDALVLHFAHGVQPLDASLVPGTVIDAELVFFPGAYPLRALVKTRHAQPDSLAAWPGFAAVEEALAAYASALACNPWVERFPLALRDVVPVARDGSWAVRDAAGQVLALSPKFVRAWTLMALGGGRPLSLFGEWDGDACLPLGIWADGRFLTTS
jgi:hypothetical protein